MKLKRITCMALATTLAISMIGCGRITETNSSSSIEGEYITEAVTSQTSSLGLDSSLKDFEEQLVDGTFYVVHDGIYYPVYKYMYNSQADDEPSTVVNEERQYYYTAENFNDIPTLFPGDHLVYYSQSELLDHIIWERFKYFGPTFSIFDLQETTGGRYYLDFSDDDNIPIIPESNLYDIANLGIDKILIDKVGGIVINESVVRDKLIDGATAGTTYDLEVYTGTVYKHYNAVADTYAFTAYELFASTGIEPLQDCFWEIDIPEYFVNGYYDINFAGMVRIMRDNSYDVNTDFNEQLLFPDANTNNKSIYSDNEKLNAFKQTTDSALLGYVDPDTGKAIEDEETTGIPDVAQFRQANIKEYELWFPEGKQCSITITSSSGESTGSAIVEFDTGASTSLTYNRFDKNYTTLINGKNNKGLLTVSGFWYDYDINLVNVVLYEGQDIDNMTPIDSDATDIEAETPEAEESLVEEDGESQKEETGIVTLDQAETVEE